MVIGKLIFSQIVSIFAIYYFQSFYIFFSCVAKIVKNAIKLREWR